MLTHTRTVGILTVITHFYLVDTQLLNGRFHLPRLRTIDTRALQERLHATHQERLGEHPLRTVIEHATGDGDRPEHDVPGRLPPLDLSPQIIVDRAAYACHINEHAHVAMGKYRIAEHVSDVGCYIGVACPECHTFNMADDIAASHHRVRIHRLVKDHVRVYIGRLVVLFIEVKLARVHPHDFSDCDRSRVMDLPHIDANIDRIQ